MCSTFSECLNQHDNLKLIKIIKENPHNLDFIKYLSEHPDYINILSHIDTTSINTKQPILSLNKIIDNEPSSEDEEDNNETPEEINDSHNKSYGQPSTNTWNGTCSKCGIKGHNKRSCKKRKRSTSRPKSKSTFGSKSKSSKHTKIIKGCSCCGKIGKTIRTCGNTGHDCSNCGAGPANYRTTFNLDSDYGRGINPSRKAKKTKVNYDESDSIYNEEYDEEYDEQYDE